MKKTLTLVLAFALVLALGIGGTLAWLTFETAPIMNTFTIGNINLELTETTGTSYKVTPGAEVSKNPTVTVKANSENSYVFVKVEVSTGFDSYFDWSVDSAWTKLSGVDNVWYRNYTSTTSDVDYAVLTDNKLVVKDNVSGFTTNPTLTVTAYAIQSAVMIDVADAWDKLS